MKVTTLLFSALLFSKAALAQTGTLLVYGNLDIASSKASTGVKSNAFSLSPGVGYQFNDHWTAGANLAVSSTKTGEPQIKTSTFGAGPFIRYAYPLSDIFAVYVQLNANYITGKSDGLKSNGFSGHLFPAIGVNLKNGFALNFNFGSLGIVSSKPKSGETATSFILSFGSGAGFGISKNFGL